MDGRAEVVTPQERVQGVLDRITLVYPVFRCVSFEAYTLGEDIEIRAYLSELPERVTGEPIQATTEIRLDPWQVKHYAEMSDETLKKVMIACVRKLLKTVLLHELDEMLQYDGTIIKDPHVSTESD